MKIDNISLKKFVSQTQYESFALHPLDDKMLVSLAETRRNAFFQIIIINKGEGSITIDFERYEIKAPTICFIFPQQIHTLALSGNVQGEVIMFDHTIFCSQILATELKEYNVDLHKRVNVINYTNNNINHFEEIISIKEHIKRIETPYNNIKKIEIKFLTKIIILKTIDSTVAHKFNAVKDKDLEMYMEFRKIVDTDFRRERKVQVYCDRLGISAKRLNTLCKRYGNNTALELIHERLSLEIKKLIIYEKMPLKEIAFSLGFDSQSALNKHIRQKYQCTPSEFKKMITH